jgi:hypothetical protein
LQLINYYKILVLFVGSFEGVGHLNNQQGVNEFHKNHGWMDNPVLEVQKAD